MVFHRYRIIVGGLHVPRHVLGDKPLGGRVVMVDVRMGQQHEVHALQYLAYWHGEVDARIQVHSQGRHFCALLAQHGVE